MLWSIKPEYSNVFTEALLKLALTEEEWKSKYHIPVEVLETSKSVNCILKKPLKFSKNTVNFSLDISLNYVTVKHYNLTNIFNNTHLQSDFNNHIADAISKYLSKCQV